MVEALALSSLDELTVSSFIAFVNDELTQLIEPKDILDTMDFKKIETRIKEVSTDKNGVKRVDRLSTICSRLYLKLISDNFKPSENNGKNLVDFLLLDIIPNDLLMSLYMDISKNAPDKVKAMVKDKRLANKLLDTL